MESGAKPGRRPEGVFAVLIIGLVAGIMAVSGCSAMRTASQALEPAEATFADPDSVMIRTVEPFSVKAEYFDRSTKAIKVKKWTVNPPAYVVNESMLRARQAAKGDK